MIIFRFYARRTVRWSGFSLPSYLIKDAGIPLGRSSFAIFPSVYLLTSTCILQISKRGVIYKPSFRFLRKRRPWEKFCCRSPASQHMKQGRNIYQSQVLNPLPNIFKNLSGLVLYRCDCKEIPKRASVLSVIQNPPAKALPFSQCTSNPLNIFLICIGSLKKPTAPFT